MLHANICLLALNRLELKLSDENGFWLQNISVKTTISQNTFFIDQIG